MNYQPTSISGEIRVNSFISNDQRTANIASLSDGGFVVIWVSNGQDGDGPGVYGQRFDSAGNAVGDEFQVNTYTLLDQDNPSVVGLSDGGFVVAWESNLQDGSGRGIYGQSFNFDGTPTGDEFQINTATFASQANPQLESSSDGGFVVIWHSSDGSGDGIFGQRFDAAGNAVGVEFQINTNTVNSQFFGSVAGLNDGGFIVTWSSRGQDGSGLGIFGQRFNIDGTAVGTEFQVNTVTANDQFISSVAGLGDGGYVVTWESLFQDGSSWGIFGQRFNADGTPSGEEFQVNTFTSGVQRTPFVTGLSDGGFLVTWNSFGQDGDSWGVFGQRFDAAGVPIGDEFLVNETTSGYQSFGSNFTGIEAVAELQDGNLVFSWSGSGSGEGLEVFLRIFTVPDVEPVNEVPNAVNDEVATDEDVAVVIDVLANDSDVDGDSLVISAVTQGAKGTVVDNGDGSVTYTPNPDFNGSDSFSYTVDDGQGGTNTATVNVTVNPVNDAPVIYRDFSVSEEFGDGALNGLPWTYQYDVQEADGYLQLFQSSTDLRSRATYNFEEPLRDAEISWDANYQPSETFPFSEYFYGPTRFMIETADGDVLQVRFSMQRTSYGPDHDNSLGNYDKPQLTVFNKDGSVESFYALDLSTSDYLNLWTNFAFDLDSSSGLITIDIEGDGTIDISAENPSFIGAGLSSVMLETYGWWTGHSTFIDNFSAAGKLPISQIEISVDEDSSSGAVPILAIDPDSDVLSYSLVEGAAPSLGSVAFQGESFTYEPNLDSNGPDAFTILVDDGNGGTAELLVKVTVNPVNDAPSGTDDAYSTDEDVALTVAAEGVLANDSDADGDFLSVVLVDDVTNGTLALNADGSFSYQPYADFNGTDSFTYRANDGTVDGNLVTVNLTVNPVNDAPTLSFASEVWDQSGSGQSAGGLALGQAAQGGNFTLNSGTSLSEISLLLREFAGSQDGVFEGFSGSLSWAIYADDGMGKPGSRLFTGEDVSPRIVDTGEGQNLEIFDVTIALGDVQLAAGDYWIILHEGPWGSPYDGSDISWVRFADTAEGALRAYALDETNPDGTFRTDEIAPAFVLKSSMPAATEQVPYDLKGEISVGDVDAGEAVLSVTLTVDFGILKAVAGTSGVSIDGSDTSILTISGTTVQLNAFLNFDPDSTLTFFVNTDAPPSSAELEVIVNDNGATGSGGELTTSKTITIEINQINDDPLASSDSTSTYEDNAVIVNVLANDSDVDGDSVSVTGVTQGANGTVVPNFDGTLTYTPNPNFNGSDSFTYTISDGQGGEDTATVNVTVNPVNDAPIASGGDADPTPVPLTGDIQVNTVFAFGQEPAQIAMFGDGTFIVVWGDGLGHPNPDVHAQFFAADGTPVGEELTINPVTAGIQLVPEVAALSTGGFVAVWESWFEGGDVEWGVRAQIYDEAGAPVGDPIHANQYTANSQRFPDVTELNNGNIVITWGSFGQDGNGSAVIARVYNASGQPLSGEIQVNQTTLGDQFEPDVVALANGGFSIVWHSNPGDNTGQIFSRSFDSDGTAQGDEFLINSNDSGEHFRAGATQLDDGNLVVVWEGQGQVQSRIIDPAGVPITEVIQVNTWPISPQWLTTVAPLDDGGYVVGWSALFSDFEGYGLLMQRFSADGTKIGDEVAINEIATGNQFAPDLVQGQDGNLVAVFQADADLDGDASGVFMRTFDLPDPNGGTLADQFSNEDTPFSYTIPENAFSDPDGDLLNYTATLANGDPLPAWLLFDADTQTFLGTPPQDFNGSFEVLVTASDGELGASDTFQLIIEPVNDAPVAQDDTATVNEDQSVSGNLITGPGADTDVESDPLTVVIAGGEVPGTLVQGTYGSLIVQADGSYTYSADADITDTLAPGTIVTDTFTYEVSDGELSDIASLSIEITALDDGQVIRASRGGGDLEGSDGDDLISGGRGNETIRGGEGFDQISGDRGDDTLEGGPGIDLLDGGRGADILLGGPGDDVLVGGRGDDIQTGGPGSDIHVFGDGDKSSGNDTITDFTIGDDFLYFQDGVSIVSLTQSGADTILLLSNEGTIRLEGVTGISDPGVLETGSLPSWFGSSAISATAFQAQETETRLASTAEYELVSLSGAVPLTDVNKIDPQQRPISFSIDAAIAPLLMTAFLTTNHFSSERNAVGEVTEPFVQDASARSFAPPTLVVELTPDAPEIYFRGEGPKDWAPSNLASREGHFQTEAEAFLPNLRAVIPAELDTLRDAAPLSANNAPAIESPELLMQSLLLMADAHGQNSSNEPTSGEIAVVLAELATTSTIEKILDFYGTPETSRDPIPVSEHTTKAILETEWQSDVQLAAIEPQLIETAQEIETYQAG